jgi:hypothetical protein
MGIHATEFFSLLGNVHVQLVIYVSINNEEDSEAALGHSINAIDDG